MALWQEVHFKALELCNFKAFYGTHRIDLSTFPDQDRNLVLIGAQNNVGKTTIHEAIYYTLYGIGELPEINRKPTYVRAVWERLNRDARLEGSNEFYVSLELQVTDKKSTRNLKIIRRWTIVNLDSELIDWDIEVFENGKPLAEITDDSSAYSEFLANTIPHNIAPFFLFDGEQIQKFADDENQQEFKEAVEAILQIDIYKRLRTDVREWVIKPLDNQLDTLSDDNPIDFIKKNEEIESKLEALNRRENELIRERNEYEKESIRETKELRRLGLPGATERDDLIAEKARLEDEMRELRKELEKSADYLPLCIPSKIHQQLLDRLEAERKLGATIESRKLIESKLDRLESSLIDEPDGLSFSYDLSKFQIESFRNIYRKNSRLVFELEVEAQVRIHDISESSLNEIQSALLGVKQKLIYLPELIRQRNIASNRIRQISKQLDQLPDDPRLDEHVEEIRRLSNETGRINNEIESLLNERRNLQDEEKVVSRDLKRQQDRLSKRTDTQREIELSIKVLSVLDLFIEKFRPSRLKELENRFVEMYRKIAKDTDIVDSISFDPETFEVVLKDKKGRDPYKRQFSAGWKQMYAYALLWSLAKTSGWSLPIVIDTPVGRLDTINRENIFLKYLPNAGNQVIVLCTDTELPQYWADRLEKNIARKYILEAQVGTGHTVVKTGFFKD